MPAEPVILLLQRARAVGVTVGRTGRGALVLDIPPRAAGLAAALHACEPQLLALFDWRRAPVAQRAPCLLCRRPALLRDPADHRPAHKVCVDDLLLAARNVTEGQP
jgi:hypothetical protein